MNNRKLLLAALFGGAFLFGMNAMAYADDTSTPTTCDDGSDCTQAPDQSQDATPDDATPDEGVTQDDQDTAPPADDENGGSEDDNGDM